MSLATICSGVALRVGVQASAPWFGSTDLTAMEVCAFVQEALAQVVSDHPWQVLLRTATWTALDAEEQAFSLPLDWGGLVPGTAWSSRQRIPLVGPLSVAEWEGSRWDGSWAGRRIFTLAEGEMWMRGLPAGDTVSVRYKSATVTAQGGAAFLSDTDGAVVDERLIGFAADMLYRDAKGLPPGAASRYPVELDRARARDQPLGVLSFGRSRPMRRSGPAIIISGATPSPPPPPPPTPEPAGPVVVAGTSMVVGGLAMTVTPFSI